VLREERLLLASTPERGFFCFLAKRRLRLVGDFASVPSLKNSGLGFKEGEIKPRPEGSAFTTLSINLVVIDRL
jgi:hypothetical protein